MQIRWNLALRLAMLMMAAAAILTSCGQGPVEPLGTEVTVHVVDTQGYSVNGQGAFQLGTGSWESLAPQSTGTFVFSVPDETSRYGFAVNCPSGLQSSSTKALVYQLTVEEATEIRATCPVSFVGSATTVEGSFDATTAFATADSVQFMTELDSETVFAGTGTYGPLTAPAGSSQSLVAVAEDASSVPVAVKVLRDLNLTEATTLNVTFAAGDAVGSTTTPDFSTTVPTGWNANMGFNFIAEGNQFVSLASASDAAATTVPTVANIQAGDLYLVSSSATESVPPDRTVATVQFHSSPSSIDFDLPEPWSVVPNATVAVLPTFSGLTDLPNEPNFRGQFMAYLWDGIPDVTGTPTFGGQALIQIFASTGWLDGNTTYATPDLTGVAGFQGAKPLTGESTSYIIGSMASNLTMEELLTGPALPFGYDTGFVMPFYPPIVDGAINRIAFVQGFYTVP